MKDLNQDTEMLHYIFENVMFSKFIEQHDFICVMRQNKVSIKYTRIIETQCKQNLFIISPYYEVAEWGDCIARCVRRSRF